MLDRETVRETKEQAAREGKGWFRFTYRSRKGDAYKGAIVDTAGPLSEEEANKVLGVICGTSATQVPALKKTVPGQKKPRRSCERCKCKLVGRRGEKLCASCCLETTAPRTSGAHPNRADADAEQTDNPSQGLARRRMEEAP